MCPGEITGSPHVVKAKDVYIANNKNKICLVLFSSKTHSKASRPQEIKITAHETSGRNQNFFCPFQLLHSYINQRGSFIKDDEQLFVFSDRSPVMRWHMRMVLKKTITKLNLDPSCYNLHSMRIGRSTDLLRFGVPVDKIKHMGRWKSNTVYKYIRSF